MNSKTFFLIKALSLATVVTVPWQTVQAVPGELPFKGRIEGSFISSPAPHPPIFSSSAHAFGNATHIGDFAKVTSDMVNIATGEVEGSFTMTAANGDLLTGTYSGFSIPDIFLHTFS